MKPSEALTEASAQDALVKLSVQNALAMHELLAARSHTASGFYEAHALAARMSAIAETLSSPCFEEILRAEGYTAFWANWAKFDARGTAESGTLKKFWVLQKSKAGGT